MKNLIEGMMSIVFLSMISIFLMSYVLVESTIIQKRNDFYELYEEKLINNETGKFSGEPFSITLPFVGTIINSYQITGEIK